MIAKGTTHTNGARLAQYMVTGKDGERAELYELRGFAAADIVSAFRSEHVIAQATHCDQPFFHCQVRNPDGERLTREQWGRVAQRLESKLGLTDQPRAIAFHSKNGHEHMHIAWSRIDHDQLKAKPLPFFKLRLKETCRQLEAEMGLTKVRNERAADEPRAPKRAERAQASRLGVDAERVRQNIRDSWTHADNGRSFVAALALYGLTLAQGDRRDYVVIDDQGGLHALGKRVLGVTAAETRERLGDLDRAALPTIEAAREGLSGRHLQREFDECGIEETRRRSAGIATASDDAGMVAQNAEANRRHLELNPHLRPSAVRREIERSAADQLDRYMTDADFRRQVDAQRKELEREREHIQRNVRPNDRER